MKLDITPIDSLVELVRARAAYAKIRAERRRQEAGKQFSPFAVANQRYEDLAPPPKPSRPRRK